MERLGERSLAYWLAIAGAAILILIDVFDVTDSDLTGIGALVLILAATLLRPGGIRGSRA